MRCLLRPRVVQSRVPGTSVYHSVLQCYKYCHKASFIVYFGIIAVFVRLSGTTSLNIAANPSVTVVRACATGEAPEKSESRVGDFHILIDSKGLIILSRI